MSTYPMAVVQLSPEGSWDPLATSPFLSVIGDWSWFSAGPCSQQAPPALCQIQGKGCTCVMGNPAWQRCMGCHKRGVSSEQEITPLGSKTCQPDRITLRVVPATVRVKCGLGWWCCPWGSSVIMLRVLISLCDSDQVLEEALTKRESSPFLYLVVYDPNVSFCAAGEVWLGCSA